MIISLGSFLIYPIAQLQKQFNSGRDLYAMADAFRKNNIRGKFVSNAAGARQVERSLLLCYLLQGQDYGAAVNVHPQAAVLEALKANNIDHCILYYSNEWEKELIMASKLAENAVLIRPDIYPGVIVLSFKPAPREFN